MQLQSHGGKVKNGGVVRDIGDPGFEVVYYNYWTDFQCQAINSLFRRMWRHEFRNLKPGDLVWVDVVELNPRGKVFGYVRVRITEVLSSGEIRFFGGKHHGCMSNARVFTVHNEDELKRLVEAYPLATDVTSRQPTRT